MENVRRFEIGQVWESPRGTLWKVISFALPTIHTKYKKRQAIFRQGSNGIGRLMLRDYDAVIGWGLQTVDSTKQ